MQTRITGARPRAATALRWDTLAGEMGEVGRPGEDSELPADKRTLEVSIMLIKDWIRR
jgi:hypothetical protein